MKDMGKKFKKWAAMGLLYTAFCAVFMAPILIPLKKEMEEKRVAKLAAEQRREESRRTEAALKAIGAMAQEYPQRSEVMAENEIPKIARGTTGQAKLIDVACWFQSVVPWGEGCFGDDSGPWFCPGDPWGDGGWGVTESGQITVPPDAQAKVYDLYYNPGEFCLTDQNDEGWSIYHFQFEVVCMDVKIRHLGPQ